jgi:hypothetical protein
MQHWLIENDNGVRRIWPIEDDLPLQPGRHHLVGRVLISASGQEQRASILGGLKQPWNQRL